MLPLYEAKMIHHFDHRSRLTISRPDQRRVKIGTLPRLTLSREAMIRLSVLPRYWVDEKRRLRKGWRRRALWTQDRLLGWRDIAQYR